METTGSVGSGSHGHGHHDAGSSGSSHHSHGHHHRDRHHHHQREGECRVPAWPSKQPSFTVRLPPTAPPIVVVQPAPVDQRPVLILPPTSEFPSRGTSLQFTPNPANTRHPPFHPSNPQRRQNLIGCWQVVVILATFWFLVTTIPFPSTSTLHILPADRQLITLPGSWFSSVTLTGLSPSKAYLFETEPQPTETLYLPDRTVRPVLRGDGRFHAIRYDLYPGSTVQFDWEFSSSRFGPNLLILRGETAYNLFRNGDLQDVSREDKLHEKYHTNYGTHLLKVRTRASYYILFYMAEPDATSTGSATFRVTSKTLRLTNPIASCEGADASSCSLQLTSNGGHAHLDAYYLVVAAPSGNEYGDEVAVTLRRHARWGRYLAAYLRAALFVIVVGGFVVPIWRWLTGPLWRFMTGLRLTCGAGGCFVMWRERMQGYRAVPAQDEEGRGVPREEPPPYSEEPLAATQDTTGTSTGFGKVGAQVTRSEAALAEGFDGSAVVAGPSS
ncbi:hypothetical protein BC830DRAFT_1139952 [Chytriomyces sp. MP71]|nr:hypothetical protein BC830DRAFT_1139952 [Chytriomyces sp. MP71]